MKSTNQSFVNENMLMDSFDTSSFTFSGVSVDVLEANEYTLAHLLLDMSGSVNSYHSDLIKMVKTVVETLRDPRAPFAENILFRLVTFNGTVYEEHGFIPLTSININGYDAITSPSGMTSLYAACMNAAEATEQYGLNLSRQDYTVNAINIVTTDGGDNDSSRRFTAASVKAMTKGLIAKEAVESIRSILVGVNTQYGDVKQDLDTFFQEGGFDQYIDIANATPSAMSKLAGFISQSVSMQAASNGSGSPSKPVDLTF